MKTIILTRHAKSSWDNPDWTDFERPLNERGLRDAPFIADVVSKLVVKPDLIISSSAVRAATTSRIFAKQLNYDENTIRFDKGIFERGPKYIIKILSELDDKLNLVMLFGHNPDMTSLYSYFSGDYMDNIPTCGSFCVDLEVDSWKHISDENGTIRFYEYPKKYFKKEGFFD